MISSLFDPEQVDQHARLPRDAEVPIRQPDDHRVDVAVAFAVGDVGMPDVADAGAACAMPFAKRTNARTRTVRWSDLMMRVFLEKR